MTGEPAAALRPLVKICGITRVEDAAHAAWAGADFLGLNFWPRSKRHVTVAAAARLIAAARGARPPIKIVGLFVDQDDDAICDIHERLALDAVQLHGDETPSFAASLDLSKVRVWKAHPVRGPETIGGLHHFIVDAHVLDAPSAGRGGSGTTFDWALAAHAVAAGHRVVLAGGLTPENVAAAIAAVRPWAVDVASGVERAPGIKDPARVEAFIAAARATLTP